MRSRDQGALDAPILSHSTNHARRGSHKRPDPSRASDRPGLITTRVCWARRDQEKPPPRPAEGIPARQDGACHNAPLSPSPQCVMTETTLSKKCGLLMVKVQSALPNFN